MTAVRKAVLLAGGFGTRLREIAKDTSKLMLPLQGKPILEYSIELCKRYGITDIAMSVHHHKDKIKAHFGNGKAFGVNIHYIEELEPLGTAGCLVLDKKWLTEPFLMCNSDELKDIDLSALAQQHKESGALATVALFYAQDPSAYGAVELDGKQVKRFVEKPPAGTEPSNWCNAGLYLLDPSIIDLIAPGYVMLEKDIFPVLATQGRMYGFMFPGQWFDTGTPERYLTAQKHWKGFQTPLKGSTVRKKSVKKRVLSRK